MTTEEQLRRAQHAQTLLKDELIEEIFDVIKHDCFKSFENSHEVETREEAYRTLQGIKLFERELRRLINDKINIEKRK